LRFFSFLHPLKKIFWDYNKKKKNKVKRNLEKFGKMFVRSFCEEQGEICFFMNLTFLLAQKTVDSSAGFANLRMTALHLRFALTNFSHFTKIWLESKT